MSTAEQTTSKLAKNWPSRVFRGIHTQVAEEQIPLCFQGFSCWWAQQDVNLRPSDYESSALTAELWARLEGLSLRSHLEEEMDAGKSFRSLPAASAAQAATRPRQKNSAIRDGWITGTRRSTCAALAREESLSM